MGDVIAINDCNGNILAQYIYDEWGKVIAQIAVNEDDEETIALVNANPIRYRGYYYDNETGMYYLQSRYYDPELCRFISSDSFGYINNKEILNQNAYIYCVNNPLNFIDPTGKAYVSDAGIAVGNFIGIMFISLEAQERINDDFGYFIATVLTIKPDSFHYDYDENISKDENDKRKKESSQKFFDWFDETANDFAKFIETSFYKTVTIIKNDFFLEFFNASVKNKTTYFSLPILENVTISFGYGNKDGFFSSISDLLDGHFQIMDFENIGAGLILRSSSGGAYIEKTIDIVGNFFGHICVELEIDTNNTWLPPLPEAVPNYNGYYQMNSSVSTFIAAGVCASLLTAFTLGGVLAMVV
ncbi:MAG: RHS repeat domain-containing protein [Eubacterium sp.]